MGVKYAGNTPLPLKDLMASVRSVPNQLYPDVAKLNKLYQGAEKMRKPVDTATNSAYKFGLYKLLSKIVPGL